MQNSWDFELDELMGDERNSARSEKRAAWINSVGTVTAQKTFRREGGFRMGFVAAVFALLLLLSSLSLLLSVSLSLLLSSLSLSFSLSSSMSLSSSLLLSLSLSLLPSLSSLASFLSLSLLLRSFVDLESVFLQLSFCHLCLWVV